MPYRFSPVRLLSVVTLLIGASVLVGTVSAATSVPRGDLGEQPAIGNDASPGDSNHLARGAVFSLGQGSELTQGTWRLDSYSSNGFLMPVMDDTVVTATFDRNGPVHGHASCNDYSGPYSVGEITIHIGPLTSTRMTCDRDVMEQEHAYLDTIESAATYTIQATTLTLADVGGMPIAIFGKSLLSTGSPTSHEL